MADPFLGEIRMFGFNFPPQGWAQCDGAVLNISHNQALFSLLGASFGGDGETTFGLPDLRGRVPVHPGTGGGHSLNLGAKVGEEAVSLTVDHLPSHKHALYATSDAPEADSRGQTATGGLYAQVASQDPLYSAFDNPVEMHTAALAAAGGSQAHSNMQPFLVMNFCIALVGRFPSRN